MDNVIVLITVSDLVDKLNAVGEPYFKVFLREFNFLVRNRIIEQPKNKFPGIQINNEGAMWRHLDHVVPAYIALPEPR
jgi:hypothetical protein